MDIRISADTSLAAAFRRAPSAVEKHLASGLAGAATMVATKMRTNVRLNDSMASSDLVDSIKGFRIKHTLSARASAGVVHGAYVEHGSGPGGVPPSQSLMDWMKNHSIATGDEAEDQRVLFLIRRKIIKHGTPARPFAAPAREASEAAVRSRLERATLQALRSSGLS